MNIFLFLACIFLATFLLGRLIEKIRVPWVFASLILGFFLAVYNPFQIITSSPTFEFLANLGMYFLLFVVGFELDLRKFTGKSKFIIKGTLIIIFLEALFGSVIIKILFGYNWLISILVALSFATVGEAVLVPILDEFRILNTKLGQAILGIGALDDIIEIVVLMLAAVLIGSQSKSHLDILLIMISLGILFFLTISFTRLKEEGKKFGFLSVETLFLFSLFVFFLFLGIGYNADSTPLAALLAGISLRTFVPSKRLQLIESEVKTMCYGFFAPLFFLWVGLKADVEYIINYPFFVFLIVVISTITKLLGSYIFGRKEFGIKKSLLVGLGLSVRFSTSIIIIKLLFENQLIGLDLYSIILASSVVFQFIIPFLFSNLLARWNIKGSKNL